MSELKSPVLTDKTGREIVDALLSTGVTKKRIEEINEAGKKIIDSLPPDYSATMRQVEANTSSIAGVAGGDAWTQRTYTSGEVCIYSNRAWECVADTTSAPSAEDTGHWREISLKTLKSELQAISGTRIHVELNNFDANGNLPCTVPPARSEQYTILVRNILNGNVTAHWFDKTTGKWVYTQFGNSVPSTTGWGLMSYPID